MHLAVKTAPVGDIVSLVEMKEHLVVEHTADDDLIESIVKAVTDSFDGPNGVMGRALRTQTWYLYLDAFQDEIVLPLPPLVSVTEITYTDNDGATQTLAGSVYQASARNGVSFIQRAYNQSWPSVRGDRDCVRIEFVCGYGAIEVPAAIKQAAKLLGGHFYATREAVVISRDVAAVVPMTVDALLAPYRVVPV